MACNGNPRLINPCLSISGFSGDSSLLDGNTSLLLGQVYSTGSALVDA